DAVFATQARAEALSPGRGGLEDRVDAVIRHDAARTDGLPGTVDVWEVEVDAPAADRRAWDEPMDAAERGGARRRLAEKLTAEIGEMVRRGEAVHDPKTRSLRAMDWGDVLVLVKKRGPMFEEMLRALKRSGAPVAGADRLKLAQHPVFEDLRALARTALFPTDDLSLAGVLRSPLCDVSEERLFDLAYKRPGRLWPTLRDRAGEADFGNAADLIGGFRAAAGRATPFDLFSGLMERRDRRGLTVRQRFLTRLGSEAADAIDAFLAQALAAEQRGSRDLERFAADLDRLDQTVKREMDEPRGEVRVMTAHSSKGLEAPVVILPDTIFQDPLGDALLEIEGGGFLWCGSKKDDCAVTATAREARKKKGEEESLRLLYVGLTRARDRLILGGRIAANRKLDGVEAWWGPATQAMQTLGREVQKGDMTIRRFGPDPDTAPRAETRAADTAAPPGWLLAPPEAEAGVRLLAPSQAEAESTGRARPP
ncbi:MAG: double-strand break repair helicase AddA, partial [Brevundimonas sp.]